MRIRKFIIIPEKTHPLLDEYNKVRGELDRLMKKWENCQLRLEEVMTSLNDEAENLSRSGRCVPESCRPLSKIHHLLYYGKREY